MTGDPILEVDDLVKAFGSLAAVNHCSFRVYEREIVALIGPNGAGKSTTFDLISGFQKPDGGEVRFRGESLGNLPPYRRTLRGLGRTFQVTRVFPKMTLLENMVAASPEERGAYDRALELLALVRLDGKANEYAANLSFGQQKLLELARILMLDPALILLDEPAAGVNPSLLNELLNFIHYLRDEQGKTFLIVEHNMEVVMGHSDRVIVMNAGSVIAEGPPAAIQENEEVLEAYFGQVLGGEGA